MPKLSDTIEKIKKNPPKVKPRPKRRPYLEGVSISETADKNLGVTNAPITEAEAPKREEGEIKASVPFSSLVTEVTEAELPKRVEDKKEEIENRVLDNPPIIEEARPAMTLATTPISPKKEEAPAQSASIDKKAFKSNHPNFRFEVLGAISKKILIYLFEEAKNSKDKITEPLNKAVVAEKLGIPYNSMRTISQRFCHRKFIKIVNSCSGKHGYTQYRFADDIFDFLLYRRDESALHSSNNPDNIIEMDGPLVIPETLEILGFRKNHLDQLTRSGIKKRVLQDSIDQFNFDCIQEGFATKLRSPVAVFMKIVRSEGRYISSRGYVSAEDEIMAAQIAAKKEALERKKKQKEELLNIEFESWLSEKTKDEIEELVPSESLSYMGQFHKESVKTYYESEVYLK